VAAATTPIDLIKALRDDPVAISVLLPRNPLKGGHKGDGVKTTLPVLVNEAAGRKKRGTTRRRNS
jgi:hypothetical protein